VKDDIRKHKEALHKRQEDARKHHDALKKNVEDKKRATTEAPLK
jgi:hypothetical protein